MFNAFMNGMFRGMIGDVGYSYETKDDHQNNVENTTNKTALRSLCQDSSMDRNSGNQDRGTIDRERTTRWDVVARETAQGAMNTVGAVVSAKEGNFTQGVTQTALAADNFYQAGKEVAPVVGNVCEFLGNEINKNDVYWDSMDKK